MRLLWHFEGCIFCEPRFLCHIQMLMHSPLKAVKIKLEYRQETVAVCHACIIAQWDSFLCVSQLVRTLRSEHSVSLDALVSLELRARAQRWQLEPPNLLISSLENMIHNRKIHGWGPLSCLAVIWVSLAPKRAVTVLKVCCNHGRWIWLNLLVQNLSQVFRWVKKASAYPCSTIWTIQSVLMPIWKDTS